MKVNAFIELDSHRYGGANPKDALMKVVKILLNGDKIKDVKKHTDEFNKLLKSRNLIVSGYACNGFRRIGTHLNISIYSQYKLSGP